MNITDGKTAPLNSQAERLPVIQAEGEAIREQNDQSDGEGDGGEPVGRQCRP